MIHLLPAVPADEVPRLDYDVAAVTAAQHAARPFVVALPRRRAHDVASVAALLATRGELSVPIKESPSRRHAPHRDHGWTVRRVSLDRYLEHLRDPAPEHFWYLMDVPLEGELAGLADELGLCDALIGHDASVAQIWMGRAGTVTPLHYDVPSNWIAQVAGDKHVLLAPPALARRLAPLPLTSRSANYAGVDLRDDAVADSLRDGGYQACRLGPGDALHIPSGWWHHVTSLSDCVTVNRWWRAELDTVDPAALARFVGGEGLYGASRHFAEFFRGAPGEETTGLAEHLWQRGEVMGAALAAASTWIALRRRREPVARELSIVETWRDGRAYPSERQSERIYRALLAACRDQA